MTTFQIEPGQQPLYLAIVKAMRREIDAGTLTAGTRLPTHRELADELGVAVGTVTRAYAEAERRGLIRGEIGRGTFVQGVRKDLPPDNRSSATDAYPGVPQSTEEIPFLDLSRNFPLYSHDPDLSVALAALAKDPDAVNLLRYQASEGTARHRRIGAEWTSRFGVKASEENIVVCAGAQHALTCTFAAVARPGERILMEELTYPGARGAAEMLGMKVAGVAMDQGGVIPESLAEACRRRKARALYLTPTLQNPTATTLSRRRRKEIVKIAREQDLWIVEDDVHRRLIPDAPPPIASLAPERTFYIAGTSKSVCGGLRAAFLVCPPALLGRVVQNVWSTVWMVAPFGVEIFARWLEDGTAEATVERKRAECAVRQELATKRLDGFSFRSHPNSLFLWLDLPEPWTSAGFVQAARERGVAVTPSSMFQVEAGTPPAAVRVCLGAVRNRTEVDRALRTLAKVLSTSPGVTESFV